MIKLKNLSKRIVLLFILFCFFENHLVEATKILIFEPLGFFEPLYKNSFTIHESYSIGEKTIFKKRNEEQTSHALDILSVYDSYNPELTEIDVLYKDEELFNSFSKEGGTYQKICDNFKTFLKEKKYDIISCSFYPCFGYDLPLLKAIMDTLIETNTFLFILAGNHNRQIYSSFETLLAHEGVKNILFVGACDTDGKKEHYSNYSNFLSRDHFVYTKGNFVRNNEEIEGTSLATPFLAAYAARLKNENPDLMVFDLKNMILDKAILTDPNDHTLGLGYISPE
ncbi:MAG: S8/S53 family peptidase [Alphaproteobacteria bacterium]|nr:S8/S53 family peptidase [Alphaproteobacteria bacterium]